MGSREKEKNNGLVILLVTDQRCIQFYTGYGLEGDLPDAICKRIQTKYMIPYLKDGNWDAGMVAGVKAVCSRLDGTMVNDTEEEDDLSVGGILLGLIGFLAVASIIGILAQRAANKCPNCGQHKLQRSSSVLISRRNGVKTEDVTYTCRNCGHKVVRRQQSYDENYPGRRRRWSGHLRWWRSLRRRWRRRLQRRQLRRRYGRWRWSRFPVLTPRMCHLCAINRFDTPSRILEENKTFT